MPSRCSEWSNADVLRHLGDVDGWLSAFWSGDPPPFTSFDPRTTPHEFVLQGRAMPDDDARDRFVASTRSMASDLEDTNPERWGLPSISPMGAVPWWLSDLHIFYDSWVHERDVFVPLGVEPPLEPDEATAVLVYSLGLVGARITEPTDVTICGVRLVTGDGPAVVTPVDAVGDCAAVIDALSGRGRLEDALPDEQPSVIETLGWLARLFLTPA